jgi:hypothetical protein
LVDFVCDEWVHPPAPEQPAPALASAPRVPQGWRLVPVEPTEAMLRESLIPAEEAARYYTRMLAAAPQPDGQ